MIKISRGCNFHITFENGVTVSVLIGGGSYSDNHDDIDLIELKQERQEFRSSNAEIAAWKTGGQWVTKELVTDTNDDVLGWQTPAQILAFLNRASNWGGK